MKKEFIDEVIGCLPEDRTLFHYFKGQYAYRLLSYAAQSRQTVGALKQSAYHRLLRQPAIKLLLAQAGNGQLSPELFDSVWQESEVFVLTLDTWGNSDQWTNQVTRPGRNLVLQLNFSEKHNRVFNKLVKPEDEFIFNYQGHPVMAAGKRKLFRDTLAWARLDIDLHSGEVLIEEIQSDWVRRVSSCVQGIQSGNNTWHLDHCHCEPLSFINYAENVFAPFMALWSEAMLMAAISFIYAELGIRKIYYHTFTTGAQLKQIYGKPPRSLYSELPRKFCFELTDEHPVFLQQEKSFIRKQRSIKNINWYKLEL